MLMLSRVRDHLGHLGLCNLISKDPTNAFSLGMHLQHNASCFRTVHRKETLQDINHELHGSVVVIDQHYLVKGRPLELRRRFFDDQACSIPPSFNVTHESLVYRVRLASLQDVQGRSPGKVPCRQSVSVYFNKEKQMLDPSSMSPYDHRSR